MCWKTASITDLLTDEDRVVGAVGIARNKATGYIIKAGATVLAAGGAGRLFTVTSNPADVCGGGFALALRAGARLRDMEFIQFYPWRLIRPFKSSRVPIQPSTFSMGGRLYNSKGERFMERYDPDRKESTTRDLSARGIFDQIKAGLGIEGGVRLDVSQVPDDRVPLREFQGGRPARSEKDRLSVDRTRRRTGGTFLHGRRADR